MTTADTAIRVRDVSHQFGEPGDAQFVQALQHTSLDIVRGELLCLIGPSGCGKSTLLNMIGGLLTPTTGTVEVHGKPVRGPLPHDIAFVFQENALFPWCTIVENVKLGMVFQGVPKAEHEPRARKALEAVGLAGLHGPLSGAAFRRHAPARRAGAGAEPPDRHAADGRAVRCARRADPDDPRRRPFGAAVASEKTIVFVTHSLGEAVFLADRVAVFSARPGRIKEIVAVDEPHPRKPAFVTTEKFSRLRNTLYELLHEEIRKAVEQSATAVPRS